MKSNIFYIQTEQKKISQLVTAEFKKYYLTGGTALAFYFNHRFSEDLDFFSQNYNPLDPDKIMGYIKIQTGYDFHLEAEQNKPGMIPMKVYYLTLKKSCLLKIDFVQDYSKNMGKIKNGLHSVTDIYYRKIITTIGAITKQDNTGRVIYVGRQTVKDLFDLYYLSTQREPLSEFFLEHFSYDKVGSILAWYNNFNRTQLKIELLDLVPRVDTAKIIKHLDNELLKKLPDKLI